MSVGSLRIRLVGKRHIPARTASKLARENFGTILAVEQLPDGLNTTGRG